MASYLAKFAFLMHISFNFQPKISDFSDSLGVLQHPLAPPAIRLWQYAIAVWVTRRLRRSSFLL